MVGKESPSEDLTRHCVHDRCDAVQEILAIRIRDEDSSTLDSSHHDMVESAWGVETWTARHVGSLSASEKDVNGSNGTTSPMAPLWHDSPRYARPSERGVSTHGQAEKKEKMTNVPTAPIHYGLQTGNLILRGRPKGLWENPVAYRRTSVSRLRAKGGHDDSTNC